MEDLHSGLLKYLGLEGSEVILPAYTCSVVAHAVSLSNYIPVFVDINLYDYNMNHEKLFNSITKKTRVIILTHTFGYPQNIDEVTEIIKIFEEKYNHKIWLVNDCCHAFGAKWNNNNVGSYGDISIYAFNISKNDNFSFGGMATFQDKNLAEKFREWRNKHFYNATYLKSIYRRIYLTAIFIAFNRIYINILIFFKQNFIS